MASLAEIRAALKATLKAAITDLNVYSEVSDVQQLPAVVVMPTPPTVSGYVCNFNGAFGRGMDEWTLDLYILVGRTDGALAQQKLDQYVTGKGPKSVCQILFSNAAIGLADGTDVTPEGITDYGGAFASAGIAHVGAVLRITVRTPSN